MFLLTLFMSIGSLLRRPVRRAGGGAAGRLGAPAPPLEYIYIYIYMVAPPPEIYL